MEVDDLGVASVIGLVVVACAFIEGLVVRLISHLGYEMVGLGM